MGASYKITADCKIDSQTYLNFCRFHQFFANKFSWNILFFPLLLLGFAIFNWYLGSMMIGWVLLALSVIGPCWALLFFHMDTYKQIKKFALDTPSVFYTITFDNEKIHIHNKKEAVDYNWNTVYSIYQTPHYFYLYLTRANAFIIPKSCLFGDGVNDLWTLFSTQVDSSKMYLKKVFYEHINLHF